MAVRLVRAGRLANLLAGLLLAGVSLVRFAREGLPGPLMLLLAILAAGPLEDWLKRRYARGPSARAEAVRQVIDQATSLLLLLALLVAALLY